MHEPIDDASLPPGFVRVAVRGGYAWYVEACDVRLFNGMGLVYVGLRSDPENAVVLDEPLAPLLKRMSDAIKSAKGAT